MTSFGTDMLAAALSVIAEFGQAVTFQVPGTETYATETGAYGEGTVIPTAATISPFLEQLEQYADFLGPLIEDIDAMCFVAASGLTFTPDQGMRITDGAGVVWRIIKVRALSGDSRAAAYELFVSR